MGKRTERVFKKNSPRPNTASHNDASWSTEPDGFLEHSPSGENLYYEGPALQKIILVFGVPPCLLLTESLKAATFKIEHNK